MLLRMLLQNVFNWFVPYANGLWNAGPFSAVHLERYNEYMNNEQTNITFINQNFKLEDYETAGLDSIAASISFQWSSFQWILHWDHLVALSQGSIKCWHQFFRPQSLRRPPLFCWRKVVVSSNTCAASAHSPRPSPRQTTSRHLKHSLRTNACEQTNTTLTFPMNTSENY